MPQPLGHKDAAQFRTIVRFYEAKQYKKGLKAADQLLTKNPDHGETQAMKVLILNAQGHTTEAFDLAKIALRNDMQSHVCWHVYGLLYQTVKKYDDAIKAYKTALRLDPQSPQIQRDLATLQIHMRDYPGFLQTRKLMFTGKSAMGQNWTALAVAQYLVKDLKSAEETLTGYENLNKGVSGPGSPVDVERSEVHLFKNKIIAESGDVERALHHLETIAANSLDRSTVMERRVEYLIKLNRMDEALTACKALVKRNTENYTYLERFEKCHLLDRSNVAHHDDLTKLYDDLAKQFPRSDSMRRVPLNFLTGNQFNVAAEAYVRRLLARCVPSTFATVKSLYSDALKREFFVNFVRDQLIPEVDAETKFSPDSTDKVTKPNEQLVMKLYFIVQHNDYWRTRSLDIAEKYLNQALALDENSVYLHMAKARILKHSGQIAEAAEAMNQAREKDERDRYINTKCVKYRLRNNENDLALKIAGKFTRYSEPDAILGDLLDMQCLWYLIEDGESYFRQGQLGLALKRFKSIFDIFESWKDDQVDFHSFSIRKGQINAYLEMLERWDKSWEHDIFRRAGIAAMKIYINLHDKLTPNSCCSVETCEDKVNKDGSTIEMDEKRNMAKRERKAQAKAREANAKKSAQTGQTGTGKFAGSGKAANQESGGPKKIVDLDPRGENLVKVKEPINEALNWLRPCLKFHARSCEVHDISVQVYLRKRKYLPALKSLLALEALNPTYGKLNSLVENFNLQYRQEKQNLNEDVIKAIDANLPLGGKRIDMSG